MPIRYSKEIENFFFVIIVPTIPKVRAKHTRFNHLYQRMTTANGDWQRRRRSVRRSLLGEPARGGSNYYLIFSLINRTA